MLPTFEDEVAKQHASSDVPETAVDMGTITPMSEPKATTPDAESSGGSWLPSYGDSAASLLTNEKLSTARQWFSERRQTMASWRTFVDTKKFRLPKTPVVAGQRILKNVEQFQMNYAMIFVILMLYCILTSPILLFALGACASMFYYLRSRATSGTLKIAGRDVTPMYQYAAVAVLSFPLFWIAGAGSVIFWVIGASIFFILLHAITFASEPNPSEDFETAIQTI